MTSVHDNSSSRTWTACVGHAGQRLAAAIVEVRRHLHAHPELSMHEIETTRYLAERVRSLDLTPLLTPQQIGLTVDWESSLKPASRRRIGLRGDIDALPIETMTQSEYASRCVGVMHACGHDAHAAMVWGALAILRRLDSDGQLPWPVSVRGIFQPAEETSEGGPLMIAAGALEGIDGVLALHVDPTLAIGKVAGRAGAFTAACDVFDVHFTGRSGHSARPHLCADTIAAATSWITQTYARVHRCHDCRDPAVISVGTIQGGTAMNIVAGKTHLSGTLRTFSEATRAAVMQELQRIASSVEQSSGCQIEMQFSGYTPSVHNDPHLHQSMTQVARQLTAITAVEHIDLPSMGAEDFAFFATQMPACMMRLGIAGPVLGTHALHTPSFDIDEQALTIGAELLAASAIECCRVDLEKAPTGKSD